MQVVIYSNESMECDRTKMLLESLKNLQIEIQEYILGKQFTQRQFEMEFGVNAQYPQINIGVEHVGGLKDMLHWLDDRGHFL